MNHTYLQYCCCTTAGIQYTVSYCRAPTDMYSSTYSVNKRFMDQFIQSLLRTPESSGEVPLHQKAREPKSTVPTLVLCTQCSDTTNNIVPCRIQYAYVISTSIYTCTAYTCSTYHHTVYLRVSEHSTSITRRYKQLTNFIDF